MGESFLGFPNGRKNIDTLEESLYNPNHYLSAHMGYVLDQKISKYLMLTGGELTGLLKTEQLSPTAPNIYDIGKENTPYHHMYATNFIGSLIGNAATASKLNTPVEVQLTGAVTGKSNFDGSQSITIQTSVNHTHHDDYLKLTGGTLTGNIKLGTNASIVNLTDKNLISYRDDILKINEASILSGQGNTTIYTAGDLTVLTGSSGITVTSSSFKKTINIGVSSNGVYIRNTTGNHSLSLDDNGWGYIDENRIIDHGILSKTEESLRMKINELQETINSLNNQLTFVGNILGTYGAKIDKLEVKMNIKPEKDWALTEDTSIIENLDTIIGELLTKKGGIN